MADDVERAARDAVRTRPAAVASAAATADEAQLAAEIAGEKRACPATLASGDELLEGVMHSFEARYSALEVEQLLRRQRSHRFAVSRPATAKVQQYLDLAPSEAEFRCLLMNRTVATASTV